MGNVFSSCKQSPKKKEQQPENDCYHDFHFPFPNESYNTERSVPRLNPTMLNTTSSTVPTMYFLL